MTTIKLKSLSSGSCGNCYFLGIFSEDGRKCEAGVLIDAGVSPRRLKRELTPLGLSFDDFSAILVTHDHNDHIRSLGSYCKHARKPVWSTPKLLSRLCGHYITGPYLTDCRRNMEEGWNDVVPGRISVRYFEVPHDATQTVGFAMMLDGHRYVHITDCGRMTREAMDWCRQADTVVLESNYDPEMLYNGPYPPDLQERIRGGHGHLSNEECADAIREFMHPGLKSIYLCHLSEHNNTPELALTSARSAVEGMDVRIVPLPRQSASPLFNL